jgi:hypothetical protein
VSERTRAFAGLSRSMAKTLPLTYECATVVLLYHPGVLTTLLAQPCGLSRGSSMGLTVRELRPDSRRLTSSGQSVSFRDGVGVTVG